VKPCLKNQNEAYVPKPNKETQNMAIKYTQNIATK
jgi:hypothetical protein